MASRTTYISNLILYLEVDIKSRLEALRKRPQYIHTICAPVGSNKPLIPSDLLYLRANHRLIATVTIKATMDFLASTTDIQAVIACMQLKQCLQVPTTLSAAAAAENILTVATTSGTKTASTVEAKSPMINTEFI